jgi:hypothetical protein
VTFKFPELEAAQAALYTAVQRLNELHCTPTEFTKGDPKVMSAVADLQSARDKVVKAVADTVAFLKQTATDVVSGKDAAQVAADLNAQADALEAALIPAPAGGAPTP